MAKANSFKSQPWTAFQKGEISIFEDDFVHEKLLTLKATRKGTASTISLKETFNQKQGKITSADELKVWFPFRETRTLYGRIKNDGFKLHYDHGILNNNDYRFNLYGSVQGKRSISQLVYKIGVETQNKDVVINWRLRYSQGEALNFYNKVNYSQSCWNLGLFNSFDVTGQTWNHSTLQLSWKQNQNNYYVRVNGGKKYERVNPRNFLEAITFNVVHKLPDSTKLGLELHGNALATEVTNAVVAWDHRCSQTANTGIRVKGDLRRNLSFSVKNSLHDYGSYIFGVNVHDFGGANRFSYGVQLDLTL